MLNLLRVAQWSDANCTKQRDIAAEFEELVELHYKHVYRLIYRMVRNEADAADLTQDTFIRVYRSLHRFRRDTSVSAWIRTIAANVCVDFIRRKRRTPACTSLEVERTRIEALPDAEHILEYTDDPAEVAERADLRRTVHAAIDTLPESYRAVLLMHHIYDMRVDDVAEALGVPPGTVKSRLSRARQALARRLGPLLSGTVSPA